MNKIFSVTQKELLRMLSVTYTVAQDETRPILTGVCFNNNETCALDDYRLSLRISHEYENKSTFVVNQFSINVLKSILKDDDDIVNVYHDMNNTVKFEINNIIIIAKCLEGEFIKYKSFIPQEHRYKSTLNLNELTDEINFIKTADERDYLKTIFKKDQIILKGNQCKKTYNAEKSYKEQERRQEILTREYNTNHMLWLEKKKAAEDRGKQFKTKEPICKQAKFIKEFDLIPVNNITSKINAMNELDREEEFEIAYNPKYMEEALKQYKNNDNVELRMTTRVSPIVVTNNIEQGLELVLPIRIID